MTLNVKVIISVSDVSVLKVKTNTLLHCFRKCFVSAWFAVFIAYTVRVFAITVEQIFGLCCRRSKAYTTYKTDCSRSQLATSRKRLVSRRYRILSVDKLAVLWLKLPWPLQVFGRSTMCTAVAARGQGAPGQMTCLKGFRPGCLPGFRPGCHFFLSKKNVYRREHIRNDTVPYCLRDSTIKSIR